MPERTWLGNYLLSIDLLKCLEKQGSHDPLSRGSAAPLWKSIYLPLVLMELQAPEYKWVTTVQHKENGLHQYCTPELNRRNCNINTLEVFILLKSTQQEACSEMSGLQIFFMFLWPCIVSKALHLVGFLSSSLTLSSRVYKFLLGTLGAMETKAFRSSETSGNDNPETRRHVPAEWPHHTVNLLHVDHSPPRVERNKESK